MEYQKIVEAIESTLEAADESVIDKIPKLSQDYALACREVNGRLDECDLFLRSDHYAEALRLSDASPRLLESCGILQFDRLSEWKNICRMVENAEMPEPINKEVMNRLIKVLDSETLPLVRELRRLSLIKASPFRRLEVLYKLHEMEPDNACWLSSIPVLEQALAEDLSAQFELLQNKKDNISEISDISNQVESIPWLNVPTELYGKLKAWNRNMVLQKAMVYLRNTASEAAKILQNLQASPAADPLEDLRKLEDPIARWQKIIHESKFPEKLLPYDIKEQMRPVFEFFEQKRFEAETVQNNKKKINQFAEDFRNELSQYELPLKKIEQSLNDLTTLANSVNLDIPEAIKNFYDKELERSKKKNKRNKILIAGSIAVGLLLIGLIVAAVIVTQK